MSFRSALALSCREPKVSISAIYLSICHLYPDNFYILFTLNNLFTFTLSHRDLHNIMGLIYIDVITTTRSDISYHAHFCFQCIRLKIPGGIRAAINGSTIVGTCTLYLTFDTLSHDQVGCLCG